MKTITTALIVTLFLSASAFAVDPAPTGVGPNQPINCKDVPNIMKAKAQAQAASGEEKPADVKEAK